MEPPDHRLAFVLVDEDVPEVAAAHILLVVVPAGRDRRRVQVADAALDVEADEQARRRVDDRRQEVVLGSQLGLEPLVVERERHGCRHAADELGFLLERCIVDDRSDPPPVVLHHRRDAPRARCRELESSAVAVDEPALLDDVRELDRRVAERVRNRVAKRGALPDRDHEPRDRPACEVAAQDPEEERERDGREQDEEHGRESVRDPRREVGAQVAEQQQEERGGSRAVDRRENAAQGLARSPPAPEEDGDDRDDQADDDQRRDGQHDPLDRVRLVHDDNAVPAVLARGRMLREEQEQRGADDDEDGRDPDDQPVRSRGESPGWEGEDECSERDEGQAADELRDRVDGVVVRVVERPEEPQVPDGGEVEACAVLGPAVDRNQPGDDEREPGREREGDLGDLLVVVVARENDRERNGRLRERDGDGEDEEASAQRRSERTAAPESSAFGTKPQAPHAAICSP